MKQFSQMTLKLHCAN